MPKEMKCPLCGEVMKKKCYVSSADGSVVREFLECPHCNLKL